MSQVARSTTGGAAGARTTGMTAASKGTGASEIGLADDLGSMSTVPFGCLLLSLPIRAALGVPFWRGFLGIHFKSMYVDFLSSHRNCVQLSQPVLAYATASLLPPCPRSPFSSLSPVIFVSRRWRRVRRGSPSSRGPRPLETFAHGPVSSGPIRRCSVCPAWRYFPIFLAMGIRDFTWVVAWEMEMARRRPKR